MWELLTNSVSTPLSKLPPLYAYVGVRSKRNMFQGTKTSGGSIGSCFRPYRSLSDTLGTHGHNLVASSIDDSCVWAQYFRIREWRRKKRSGQKFEDAPWMGSDARLATVAGSTIWEDCGAISVLKQTLQYEGIGKPQKSIRRGA